MKHRTDTMGIIRPCGAELVHNAITVTDSATAIPTVNQVDRKAISVRNWSGSEKVYLGNSGVTTANGFPILPYESLPLNIADGGDVYGICETGKTAEIRYIELDAG